MCGGRGTRLETPVEKPLFEIGDRPMVQRVLAALEDSGVDEVSAVVSPHVPQTRAYLDERGTPQIETAGAGYVEDLDHALAVVDRPVLTVAADLPLLGSDAIDRVLDAHGEKSTTVCVPAALKRLLGLSVGTSFERGGRELAPTGLNVVSHGRTDTVCVSYDARVAVNVNRQTDARIAEALR
ncbi:MAG: NTP transferase domain-containing protein [Halobacteriota archaeon]